MIERILLDRYGARILFDRYGATRWSNGDWWVWFMFLKPQRQVTAVGEGLLLLGWRVLARYWEYIRERWSRYWQNHGLLEYTDGKLSKHGPKWVDNLFRFWTYSNCFKHFLIELGCWNFGCRFGPLFCMGLLYIV